MSEIPQEQIRGEGVFRVLCLDGGGMRGLYTAAVLETLIAACNSTEGRGNFDVGLAFDLVVGTSTGGIIACGIAAGVPISKIVDLYKTHGPEIFKSPAPKAFIPLLRWSIRHSRRAANSNNILKEKLVDILGNETIGDLYHRRSIGLAVPSVNLAGHNAQVFKTPHNPRKHADNPRKLVDVCLATSAAPILFPIASIPAPHLGTNESFVDGGLWANNPVLIAVIEAMEMTEVAQPIEIVSIGTCPPPSGKVLLADESNWGVWRWKVGIEALSLAMDAQADGAHRIARFLSTHLSQLGRSIQIHRLPQSAPSSEQSDLMKIDSASPRAISALCNLGRKDGLEAYSEICQMGNSLSAIHPVFHDLPPIMER